MDKQQSLKKTLLNNYLIMSIMPFVVGLSISLFYLSNFFNKDIEDDQTMLINLAKEEAQRIITEPGKILDVIDDVYNDNLLSQHITGYIDSILQHNDLFEIILIINNEGKIVVAPTLDQDIVGFDMSFQDFYLERASYDETYWSKVFISSESSNPTLAYVIKGQGNYSIVAYYSLFELQKVINNLELDNQGIIAIVDSEGQYIAHSDHNNVAYGSYDEHFDTYDLSEAQVLDYEGTRYITRTQKLDDLNFYISVRTPYYNHYINILRIIITGIIIIITVTIIIAYLSNAQSTSILKPMTHLIEEMDKIATGKYGEIIELDSFEEINLLTKYFNNMSLMIKDNFEYLSDSRAELESLNQDLLLQNDEIARSEIEIATILGNLYSGIMLLSPNLEILRMNSAIYRLLNIPISKSSYHVDAIEFFKDIDDVCRKTSIDMVRFSKKKLTSIINKEDRLIEQSIIPLVNRKEEITGIIISFKDITEQKNLEIQLNRSMKLEAIGRLAGGIAHDFNNILQIIIGYSELVDIQLDQVEGSAKLKYQIGLMSDSARKAEKLVKKLMLFSKMDTTTPGRLNINDSVKEIRNMLSGIIGDDIIFTIELEDNLPFIYADQTQIDQTLMNLCVNAKDALPEGGAITIRTYSENKKHKGYICIEIEDNGTGMPKHIQDKIFDPFFTTKDIGKGTGLGLATVLGIVEKNHGFVELESQENIGTMFRLYFPALQNNEIIEPQEDITYKPMALGAYTILLAEDDPSVREIAREIIVGSGARVIEAIDGVDAINQFYKYKDEIDIVIFDVLLPNINGVEAYETIKNISPYIKVIFTTGYSNELLNNGYNLDLNGKVLQKPYQKNTLLAALYEIAQL
ncbi:MAG: ATP-binding protein [Vallitaleaceae bacterium]|jgi:signal transduction histidine kinase/CheY-like chemotaxis protein|nr:ATP-binding protein [Vallitaleaceae bacterium]